MKFIDSNEFYNIADENYYHCGEFMFKYYCKNCEEFMGCYFCEFDYTEKCECEVNHTPAIGVSLENVGGIGYNSDHNERKTK